MDDTDDLDYVDARPVDTGIEPDNMYRMSAVVIDALATSGLSRNALRLYHGLWHQTCREVDEWFTGFWEADRLFRMRCCDLRSRLGISGSNGNRDIVAALEELRDLGCFVSLELKYGNLWIEWQFTQDHVWANFDDSIYALLDITLLPRLRSALDIQLAMWVCLARRMYYPSFLVSLDTLSALGKGASGTWGAMKPRIAGALSRVAEHFELSVCIHAMETGTRRGTDMLRIFPMQQSRRYNYRRLLKCDTRVRKAFVIDSGTCQPCDPALAWRLVRGVQGNAKDEGVHA